MTAALYDALWADSLASRRGAVLQAAEEVLAGTIGSVRTVPAGIVGKGAWDGATDEKVGADALVKVMADVRLMDVERTGAIAPETCDLSVDKVTLRFRLAFSAPDELNDELRRAARAVCWTLVEVAQDALAWPGNLTQTSEPRATNLIGAALTRSGPARVVREDPAKRIFVAEFQMTGLVQRTRAVA